MVEGAAAWLSIVAHRGRIFMATKSSLEGRPARVSAKAPEKIPKKARGQESGVVAGSDHGALGTFGETADSSSQA
jgi:hypothetical protein